MVNLWDIAQWSLLQGFLPPGQLAASWGVLADVGYIAELDHVWAAYQVLIAADQRIQVVGMWQAETTGCR
jgi:hypothetical protein